jgi:flagellar hook-associated protein 1 FlgK
MANDLLGVSVTGLKVSQTALRTVGHNIANAGTEGYSRQRIDPVTNPAVLMGRNYVGSGVNVNSVDRIVNGFVTEQMRSDSALFNDLETYFNQISQLDNLLSDESTGLGASLNTFFSAMQNGADDPTSIPARQLIISESENLADRFNSIHDRLRVIGNGVDSGMEVAVSQINVLAKNIAQLNLQIANTMGTTNQQPNDLLDQRDLAIKELSSLVSVQVFDEGNGQVNVSIGTGQTLVIGKQARQLELTNSAGNAAKKDVVFFDGNTRQVVTDVINGGKLGGLIRFRDDTMTSIYNQLGRVAVVMADTFNQVHQQGVDLDGEFGGLFFYDINAEDLARGRVIGNANNAAPADRQLALYIEDSSLVTSSDYEVSMSSGGFFRVTRLEDGTEVAKGLLNGQLPSSITFDGMELELQRGSFQPGDKFLVQPTRYASRDFHTSVSAPRDIAFASPLVTDAALGNRGSGAISAGEILSLKDVNGNPLPLFADAGTMSPPLIVVFNTPYSYDILDNSDPGNPVHLNPPLRDQRYVPGVTQNLFPSIPGSTQVSTNGDMVGLPEGRAAITQAALLTAGSPPDFSLTDFSGLADQFSFDVTVSGTPGGADDGVFSVTVSGSALQDEQALVTHLNAQLATSDVAAYIADDGSVAFRLRSPGYGDISLDNYSGGVPGQANNLLGFDIEGSTYTTLGNADGIAGSGSLTNGYPAEMFTITRPSATPGGKPVSVNVFTPQNASAKELANVLSSQPGVEANAFNYLEMSDLQLTRTAPLQLRLNGEDLLAYTADPVTGAAGLASAVPDPATDPDGFYDYVAARINENANLQKIGIHAVAGEDALTGARELRIYSSEGDDLQVSLTAAAGDTLNIGDGDSSPLVLTGAGNSVSSQILVGGRLDVTFDEGITMSGFPPDSMIFGNTRAADFAQANYLGIQASISGTPQAGDRFTLDFNRDGAMDSRNALKLVDLQHAKTAGAGATFSQIYGGLVESVGIDTSSAKINRNAAEQVLQQSEELRNSISGVNLDEEAADLIRFEQLFSANAQVISVARDIFDRLIGAF